MPMYERLSVKVRLVVEVDGHILTFEETGKANGGRYHGAASNDTNLESNVRGAVDTCVARASKKVEQFLARAYPVHSDAPTKEAS